MMVSVLNPEFVKWVMSCRPNNRGPLRVGLDSCYGSKPMNFLWSISGERPVDGTKEGVHFFGG